MDSTHIADSAASQASTGSADVPSAPEPASEVLGPPEAPEEISAAPPTQPPERVDAKLWSGASAAGWRLSCGTGGSGDKFRSPSGISIVSREKALEAAAFEDAPAVSLLRDAFAQNWAGARARVPRAAFAGFEVVDGFAECAVAEYRVRPQEPPLPPCEEVRLAPGADHSALGELWVTKKQLLGESAIVRDLPCELVDPPHSGGEAIVGRRVCVYWEGDDAWYAGAIVRFAAAAPSGSARWPPPREAFHSGRHRVQYDDGTAEWVLLAAERYRLLPTAAAAAAPAPAVAVEAAPEAEPEPEPAAEAVPPAAANGAEPEAPPAAADDAAVDTESPPAATSALAGTKRRADGEPNADGATEGAPAAAANGGAAAAANGGASSSADGGASSSSNGDGGEVTNTHTSGGWSASGEWSERRGSSSSARKRVRFSEEVEVVPPPPPRDDAEEEEVDEAPLGSPTDRVDGRCVKRKAAVTGGGAAGAAAATAAAARRQDGPVVAEYMGLELFLSRDSSTGCVHPFAAQPPHPPPGAARPPPAHHRP